MPSPLELRDIARTIALEAGELIARRRAEGVEIAASKSTSIDVVTFADRESEEFIKSRLADLRPEDAFFGEEGGVASGASGLTWIVDPIDGTVNYLYGIPQYAVSIAVVEGDANPETWNQLAGVVVNPVAGEVFSAARGNGAFLGTQQLQVNNESLLGHSLVATGFAYSSDLRSAQAQVLTHLLPQVRDIRRAGAASLDLCSVAAGRVDAYFERDTKPWDYAAGSLIVREAGGIVAGLGGRSEGPDMILASNSSLFGQLESLLST